MKGPGADIACGFGTFTIPLAKIQTSTIYAVDINDNYLARLEERAREQNIQTIKIINKDITEPDFRLPERINYALLFNILHSENPEILIQQVSKNLTEKGKIFVIHWRTDIKTPRGPPLDIRPTMEDIKELMVNNGFETVNEIREISPYHYGLVFQKK